MQTSNKGEKETNSKPKRPFIKSDFETVLKVATKPLKKEQAEPKSEGT